MAEALRHNASEPSISPINRQHGYLGRREIRLHIPENPKHLGDGAGPPRTAIASVVVRGDLSGNFSLLGGDGSSDVQEGVHCWL